MSMLEGMIKPETTINPDIDIDMSKNESETQVCHNMQVFNIGSVQNLIIADERLAAQIIEALTKEKQPTQTP